MRYEKARKLHNGDEVCLHARLSSCRRAKDYGVVHRVRVGRQVIVLEIFAPDGTLIERTHREVS
jgi:hypothetical protein